jgi:hypothetical protein
MSSKVAFPSSLLLEPCRRRLQSAAMVILAVGGLWIGLTRAAAAPAIASIGPVLLALLLMPLVVRGWWPGLHMLGAMAWLQEVRWRKETGLSFSKGGASDWLANHPEPSFTSLAAMALLGETEKHDQLLAILSDDPSQEQWRIEVGKATLAIAGGDEPDLVALKSAVGAIEDPDWAVRASLAFLLAWDGARLGGDRARLLADAWKSLSPAPVARTAYVRVWKSMYMMVSLYGVGLLLVWLLFGGRPF